MNETVYGTCFKMKSAALFKVFQIILNVRWFTVDGSCCLTNVLDKSL